MAAIVGIVASLVGPVIELGKCTAMLINRQFKYLRFFNSNIQSLMDEARNLTAARNDLQIQVEAAERNAQLIFDEVANWLRRANEIDGEMSGIEIEIQNIESGCFTIKSRISLSRKAKKTTKAIKKLISSCSFNSVSYPAPPAAALPVPLGDTFEFHSRKHIEEDILEVLRSENANMMGICGMGGIGKTTMAKRIMYRAREEHLFDEIVMVVISQQVDVLRIQHEIAEPLGLMLREETLSARANKLHARLTGKKRILVVLDDVWEKLKLEDLGILSCESGFQGYNILLTSRSRDVLNQMGVQKVYGMEILSESEAWFLFRNKVGTWLDDSVSFLYTANQIVKECQGLPIALITVGSALKDKKSKPIWEDAVHQLKTSNPIDMPDVLREVYNPLKLSYKFLKNQHAECLFLLCCIFPEDHNISLEFLTFSCMGLCMFEGIWNLEQARNRVFTLVEMLKSHSLLLNGHDENHVKIHDVVRDVAIFIASEEGLVDANLVSMNCMPRGCFHSDCKWISMFPEKTNEPSDLMRFNFPSLRLLMMHHSSWERIEVKEDFCFFEGMEELKVLSLESVSLKSLPQTKQLLKNLRTLHLVNCTLETICVIGELLSLEILCCHFCNKIEELPMEIGRLDHLKLLDLSQCTSLKRIAPGVISNLVKLEELKMIDSFKSWESAEKVNGKETRNNVSLKELESLSNLTCLEIEIEDYTLVAEDICLSSKITKYCIRINAMIPQTNHTAYEKIMHLELPTDITLKNWISILLKSTEVLHLRGGGPSSNLDLLGAQKMKSLVFSHCLEVKKLVNTTTSIDWRRFDGVFPALKSLMLFNLPNLEEICDGPILEGSNSFKNLRELGLHSLPALNHLWKSSTNQNISLTNLSSIYIWNCGKLHNLFSLGIAKDALPQLEELEIWDCEMMEEIFSNDELNKKDGLGRLDQSHYRSIAFPKLKRLVLRNLQSLTTFYKGLIESIEFPVLAGMYIRDCPKLTSLVSFIGNNHQNFADGHGHDDDSFHLFCSQKVPTDELFPMLESLMLSNLPNLKEIFDGSILEGSPNSFKNLKNLLLRKLPALKHLWKSPNQYVSLCSLSSIYIENCGKLRNLFSLAIAKDALLQLEELQIVDSKMMELVFLNEEDKEDELDQSHSETITFPKLKTLVLGNLQSLAIFCGGIESIEFPVLAEIYIYNCPKLTSLVSSIENNHQSSTGDDGDNYFHLFCSQKVAFGSLKELHIGHNDDASNIWCPQIPLGFFSGIEKLVVDNCDNIRSLFSSSIVENLVNLKYLEIRSCQEMEKVIEEENTWGTSPFPRLERLRLMDLPKLERFCKWSCDLELPSLECAWIDECPLMEKLTMESLVVPNLEFFSIDDRFEDVKDLNEPLRISAAAQESTSSAKGKEGTSGSMRKRK